MDVARQISVAIAERPLRAPSALMRPVVLHLSQSMSLSHDDIELLQDLAKTRRQWEPAAVLAGDGSGAASSPRFLLSGWACLQRIMADGRRQIFGFLVPGDMIGLRPRTTNLALATTVALTPISTVDLRQAEQQQASRVGSRLLIGALLMTESEAQMRLYDHVVRLGRMSGLERAAHLMLELQHRLAAVGLASDRRFPMPLKQEDLADALGLSAVHVNRTLQVLRRRKLIDYTPRDVTFLDPGRLASLASGISESTDARTGH